MKKRIINLISIILGFLMLTSNVESLAATATVPLGITVNGALLITDASNDTMSGIDPTLNVNLSVTPDLTGSVPVSGSANFRIRSNKASWRLTTQRTASNDGGTGISDGDVSVTIAKSAGSTGNVNAGTIVAPFTSATTLVSVPTSAPANVISGSAKTSSAKDSTNANNYFQVNTTYGIAPDFFYSAGTFSTTITYNLVSP